MLGRVHRPHTQDRIKKGILPTHVIYPTKFYLPTSLNLPKSKQQYRSAVQSINNPDLYLEDKDERVA